jgi:hypothetical protein
LHGHPVVVVHDVERHSHPELFQVVEALDAFGLGLGLGEGRQQQGCQDGDDRNDDEEFDQSESAPRSKAPTPIRRKTQVRSIHVRFFAIKSGYNGILLDPPAVESSLTNLPGKITTHKQPCDKHLRNRAMRLIAIMASRARLPAWAW